VGTVERLFEKYGRAVPAGTVIFSENEPGEEMYIIQSGKVKVTRRIGLIDKTLSVLTKGDFFGEMSILNDKPRSATVVAEQKCELLAIDRKTFEAMIKSKPEIALRIIKKLASRLQEADNQIEALLVKDNTGKVASYLLRLASSARQDENGVVLDVAVPDIAGVIGITEDLASSVVSKLTKAHMLAIVAGKIVVTDIEQLGRFVNYLDMKASFGDLT
jgi:CRP/FNR family transcriptional regulator, cyclic AMP receptor protein